MKTKFLFAILIFLISVTHSRAQQELKSIAQYKNYLLFTPNHLPANGQYPLLLFLHGSGERGDNLELLKKHGPPSFLDKNTDFPFVVVSPQCPQNKTWDTQNLLALLDHIESTLPIDKNKIYVTGLSMGGYGTWALAQAAPEKFAAIAPICGGVNLDRLCTIRDIPAWVFHGAKDVNVPPEESTRLVEQLREYGSDVKYTLYPNLAHNSWNETYKNKELYSWLLSKSKKENTQDIEVDILKNYVGKYKNSNESIMKVIYDENSLFLKSSTTDKKLSISPITERKFRISDLPIENLNIYFDVSSKGKVSGLTIGPCDHIYYSKME